MKERMKEPHIKGLAIHGDPESCVAHRKVGYEVLTGTSMDMVLSREINRFGAPTQSRYAEGNTEGVAIARCFLALRGRGPVARADPPVYLKEEAPAREEKGWINAVLQIGVFCFFLGILSQAVGLYQALGAIIAAGDVSPALIFGGLRVSFIAPIYGLLILLFSLASWSVLKNRFDRLAQ